MLLRRLPQLILREAQRDGSLHLRLQWQFVAGLRWATGVDLVQPHLPFEDGHRMELGIFSTGLVWDRCFCHPGGGSYAVE